MPDRVNQTAENARLLIEAIKKALAAGEAHFDKRGRPLTTEKAVLEALLRDGEVVIGANA